MSLENHVDLGAQWRPREPVDDDALSETDADIGKVSFIGADGSSVDQRHCVSNELAYLEKAAEANFLST